MGARARRGPGRAAAALGAALLPALCPGAGGVVTAPQTYVALSSALPGLMRVELQWQLEDNGMVGGQPGLGAGQQAYVRGALAENATLFLRRALPVCSLVGGRLQLRGECLEHKTWAQVGGGDDIVQCVSFARDACGLADVPADHIRAETECSRDTHRVCSDLPGGSGLAGASPVRGPVRLIVKPGGQCRDWGSGAPLLVQLQAVPEGYRRVDIATTVSAQLLEARHKDVGGGRAEADGLAAAALQVPRGHLEQGPEYDPVHLVLTGNMTAAETVARLAAAQSACHHLGAFLAGAPAARGEGGGGLREEEGKGGATPSTSRKASASVRRD